MFAAILACGKIPPRTPSGRLNADGVQLQFSPVFFISVEHHVGFLLQIKEICSHHSLQQASDIRLGDLNLCGSAAARVVVGWIAATHCHPLALQQAVPQRSTSPQRNGARHRRGMICRRSVWTPAGSTLTAWSARTTGSNAERCTRHRFLLTPQLVKASPADNHDRQSCSRGAITSPVGRPRLSMRPRRAPRRMPAAKQETM